MWLLRWLQLILKILTQSQLSTFRRRQRLEGRLHLTQRQVCHLDNLISEFKGLNTHWWYFTWTCFEYWLSSELFQIMFKSSFAWRHVLSVCCLHSLSVPSNHELMMLMTNRITSLEAHLQFQNQELANKVWNISYLALFSCDVLDYWMMELQLECSLCSSVHCWMLNVSLMRNSC